MRNSISSVVLIFEVYLKKKSFIESILKNPSFIYKLEEKMSNNVDSKFLCEDIGPSLDYCNPLPAAAYDVKYNETVFCASSDEYDIESDEDYVPYCELSENDETTSSDEDSSDASGEWSDEDLDDPIVAMYAQEHLAEIGAMPAIAG